MDKIANLHRRLVSPADKKIAEQLLLLLLVPFSYLYGVIGWVRNICYDLGYCPSYQSMLPVVSVGNLAAGGTGKTPTVDWLVKQFQMHGKCPAIVSRGFSGNFTGAVGIVSKGDGLLMTPAECGDEPYLLAKRNPGCPVLIARKRIDAVKWLEQTDLVDLIILDDGFQHRAVNRDVDLVLLDSTLPLGNRKLLPAGNLREFSGGLKRADFVLMTRTMTRNHQQFMGFKVYESSHLLGTMALSLDQKPVALSDLKKLKLLAFTGIADPDNFFSSLESIGLQLENRLGFSDHVVYQGSILTKLNCAAFGLDALITTEKDAVKLLADMFELPCYQIAMEIKINAGKELYDEINQRLWSQQ